MALAPTANRMCLNRHEFESHTLRMTKITVVKDEGGDWEAVYFDGKVQAQTHSVDYVYSILPLLVEQNIESIEVFEADLAERGWAPNTLDEFEDGELTAV
jgi:hypothetical protein